MYIKNVEEVQMTTTGKILASATQNNLGQTKLMASDMRQELRTRIQTERASQCTLGGRLKTSVRPTNRSSLRWSQRPREEVLGEATAAAQATAHGRLLRRRMARMRRVIEVEGHIPERHLLPKAGVHSEFPRRRGSLLRVPAQSVHGLARRLLPLEGVPEGHVRDLAHHVFREDEVAPPGGLSARVRALLHRVGGQVRVGVEHSQLLLREEVLQPDPHEDEEGDEEGEGHRRLLDCLQGVEDDQAEELNGGEEVEAPRPEPGDVGQPRVLARVEDAPEEEALEELVAGNGRDAHVQEDAEEDALRDVA
mmetsp:Transcript_86681/g.271226  ORF Transcript_86681/g.271226 Transcript_86681/m.271226 type:complete len:308 (-) Transcript_86681:980-1903(-)